MRNADLLKDAYRKTYEIQARNESPRFIILRPRDGCGWGNKLRALTMCFVFALCTKRILVVDDFLIEEHFSPPEGTDWSLKSWRKRIRRITDVRIMNLKLRPEDFDPIAWKDFETKHMDSLYPENVIILEQSLGFIDAIFRNPNYEPFLQSLGLETRSKLSWLGDICGFLLSAPTKKMLFAIGKISKLLNFPHDVEFGVQFRSFYDVGSSHLKYLKSFIANVRADIQKNCTSGSKPTIYILADDPKITKLLVSAFSELGTTVSWPHKTIHTADTNFGVAKIAERVLLKMSGNRVQNVDFLAWLPSQLRPRPHTSVLAEWFLLGECKRLYSTFTSFAVFAAARKFNQAILMRFDTETCTINPIKNEEYFY